MTDEVMMVPVQEFKQLQEYYKGQMTENALLNKAGRLAAEEHLILNDKRIPDSMAVKMIKPLASEEKRLVKRLRTGTTGPIAYSGTEQPEGMVDTPDENLLKQIIKGVNKDPTVPIIIKQEATTRVKEEAVSKIKKEPQPSTSGVKKTPKGPKPPIPPTPSTLTKKSTTSKSGGLKKTVLSGATKGVLKSLGLRYSDDEDEGGYSPKGKGKKKCPKAKKTALQKRQQDWEDWDKLSERKLDYDDSD